MDLAKIEQRIRIENQRRPNVPRGSAHHAAKLNEDAVRLIRKMRSEGVKVAVMARHFGVSVMTLQRVFNGRSWAHVK